MYVHDFTPKLWDYYNYVLCVYYKQRATDLSETPVYMLYVMTRLGGIIFVDADAPRPLRPSFDTSISFSLIFTPCFLGGGGFVEGTVAGCMYQSYHNWLSTKDSWFRQTCDIASRMLSIACEIASSAPCVTACAAWQQKDSSANAGFF